MNEKSCSYPSSTTMMKSCSQEPYFKEKLFFKKGEREYISAASSSKTFHQTETPIFKSVKVRNIPLEPDDLVTKEYVDSMTQKIRWNKSIKQFWDPTSSLPSNASDKDEYISLVTANGWIKNYIYEYNSSTGDWTEIVPTEYYAVWVEEGNVFNNSQIVFNGESWVKLGAYLDHNNLQNKGIKSHSEIDNHINDTSIHYVQTAIDHNNLQNKGVKTHSEIDSHINDTSIHYSRSSINHDDLQNRGFHSHTEIDTHIDDLSIHFTKGSIKHENLQNAGTKSHVQIDSHIDDTSIHYAQTSIDHANLLNKGMKTHSQIDSHIDDTNIHFTQGSINHNLIQNVGIKTHAEIDSHINDSSIHYVQTAIDHNNLQNKGTKTHVEIDSHINSTSNPHSVTKSQIGLGNVKNLKVNLNAISSPTPSNDGNEGYSVGSRWVDISNDKEYVCVDATPGAAVWKETTHIITDHSQLSGIGTKSHAQIDSHINDTSIHYAQTAIDHTNLLNKGTKTHSQIDSHIDDTNIHFTEGSINHNLIQNSGTKTHDQIDSHIDDTSIHYVQTAIDHTNLLNRGTKTHAEIDSHISSEVCHSGQSLKSSDSPTFSQINISNDPNSDSHTVRKSYLDDILKNYSWKESVISFYDPTSGTPLNPSSGDRYISQATANGWIINYVYEFNNSSWLEIVPSEGDVIWVKGGTYNSSIFVIYNGSSWTQFGTLVDHNQILNRGTKTHAEIDTHINTTTTCPHSGQDLRTTASPTFSKVILTSSAPVSNNEAVTKSYVDSFAQSVVWKEPVLAFYDPTNGLPSSPSSGDSYISLATDNGWTVDCIYTYNGSSWTETIPVSGYATWVEGGTYKANMSVLYNGNSWISFGSTVNHDNLQNRGSYSHAQIDSHINDTSIHYAQTAIDHTNLLNKGTKTHAQIDSHINDTNIHYLQTAIDHTNLLNKGTKTHAEIDSHINSTSNPHSVTKSQIGLGNVENLKVNLSATSAPTSSNDSSTGYSIGSKWVDVSNDKEYVCVDATLGAAVWKETTHIITDHSQLSGIGTKSHAQIDSHINDTSIHYAQTAIDHNNLQNKGTKTHVEIDSHIADTSIHYAQTAIDHTNLLNKGTNTHVQIDSHIADTNIHYTQTAIDHNNLLNRGTKTHAEIDSHINSTSNPHSVTKSQIGLGNVENLKVRLNAVSAPTSSNDSSSGYSVGSRWVDVSNDKEYVCVDATPGAAVWKETTHIITDHSQLSGIGTKTHAQIDSHINDTSIHYAQTAIDHTNLLNKGTKTHSQIDSHIDDTSIHFTEGSINHNLIQNIGTNTHDQIDSHIANSTIHYTMSSIDHTQIQNVGTKTHAQIDSHINDTNIHYLQTSIDHNNLQNKGTNTHAQIDSHIADSTIHYTISSIDHNSITNRGTNTHEQIDSHIASVSNPHNVTKFQIGLGNVQNWKNNITSVAPSVNNDNTEGYSIGSRWFDTTADREYICLDNSTGAAVWKDTTVISSDIDHLQIQNTGTNTHAQIDSHIADTSIHYLQTAIDHTNLQNIGTNSHADIDAHIAATNNPHNVTALQVGSATAQWNADQIQGVYVDSTAPVENDFLRYNSQTVQWEPTKAIDVGGIDAVFFDDFMGGNPLSFWDTTLSGMHSSIQGIDGIGGQLNIVSGTSTNDSAELSLINKSISISGDTEIKFRIKISDTTNTLVELGCYDTSDELVRFIYNVSGSAGNWFGETRSGAVSQSTDLNVSADNTVFHVFTLVTSSSSVKFYIDNVLKATNTMNLSTSLMRVYLKQTSKTNASRIITCDYVRVVSKREDSSVGGGGGGKCTII